MKHKGSLLGVLWLVLNPLMQMAIYSFVFGVIFEGQKAMGGASGLSYALAIFLSLTLFQFFSETLSAAPSIIVSQPNFVKKVVFPLEVLPLAAVGASAYQSGISFLLVLLGSLTVGEGISWHALWFPIVVAPLALLALGTSWLLSALGVFFRDLQQAVGPVSLLLMYASAIFYSAQSILEKEPLVWAVLRFNPLIHIIDQARQVLLWHTSPSWGGLLYCYAVSILVFFFGFACFQKLKPAYADVL